MLSRDFVRSVPTVRRRKRVCDVEIAAGLSVGVRLVSSRFELGFKLGLNKLQQG